MPMTTQWLDIHLDILIHFGVAGFYPFSLKCEQYLTGYLSFVSIIVFGWGFGGRREEAIFVWYARLDACGILSCFYLWMTFYQDVYLLLFVIHFFLWLEWMCDECTRHHKTFLEQSVYWHLAIQLYCIVKWYCIDIVMRSKATTTAPLFWAPSCEGRVEGK